MADNTPSQSVRITGGQVVAGNIGGSGNNGQINGPVHLSGGTDTDQLAAVLTQLRGELAHLRSQLASAPDSAADVDDVLGDLADPEPNINGATSRWERLRRRIPESLQNLDTIQQIVGLLEQVRELAS
ncbi:hypothetical protein [Nocardia cyriacigeorgica]|uniref:Uncharacterized protein n=1 Tax=Nocardia cyriacigeorgica TaxID=135487 RepID=A0A6P1DGJ9_9NOCA|nr:hypothetical protein [Nocardia cyriacigeorgica]NEW47693.1 hypothetical protein [Nocardia cyriacigeorgica]